MTAEAIIAVSAAVLACVQLAKWSFLPDKYGPLAVLVLAALGVWLWGYSVGTYERTQAFSYFAAWVSVALSASGTYGFSRVSGEALTKLTSPPTTGAGAEPTVKS